MKRTNIFELLADKNRNNMEKDIERILKVYQNKCFFLSKFLNTGFTLEEFFYQYCFHDWEYKGRCLDLNDFMETIGFDFMVISAKDNLNDFLTVIEVIYNFYMMSILYVETNEFKFEYNYNSAIDFKKLMDSCLSDYNHSAFYNKEKKQVIVIEDNPEAIAVAENLEPEIAFDVIRYNHNTLKGDIKTKKHILTIMGSELEPKRKQLKSINGDLEDVIFFILNNANIRHNNISEIDKNYRKFIANMSDVELEELYDELYEMMLLANLELENTERMPKMKQLKKYITSNT